jgi:hypothetical protein
MRFPLQIRRGPAGMGRFHDPELAAAAEIAAKYHMHGAILGQLVAPLGAPDVGIDVFSNGNIHLAVKVDPALSSSVPIGTLMEIENFSGPGTGNTVTVPLCQPSSTTADNKLIGPATSGYSNYSSNSNAIPVGQIANCCHFGIAQILMDATSTAGYPVIQSAATAGAAKCTASATTYPNTGQGVGTCLQAVTISTGTAAVWMLVKMV